MVTADLSIITLISEASLLVKLVMLSLLLISFYSWLIIFRKRSELEQAKRDADAFEDKFWSGNELNRLYEDISARPHASRGMEGIFEVGFPWRGKSISWKPLFLFWRRPARPALISVCSVRSGES